MHRARAAARPETMPMLTLAQSSLAPTGEQIQIVRTSIAALAPRFDEIARGFFQRLGAQVPAFGAAGGLAGGAVFDPFASRAARHEFASCVMHIAKNLGDDGACWPVLEHARRFFARVHFASPRMGVARTALYAAIREAHGDPAAGEDGWNERLAGAWNAVLHDLFACMTPAAEQAAARPARLAA